MNKVAIVAVLACLALSAQAESPGPRAPSDGRYQMMAGSKGDYLYDTSTGRVFMNMGNAPDVNNQSAPHFYECTVVPVHDSSISEYPFWALKRKP
jgi:hypothetical protein